MKTSIRIISIHLLGVLLVLSTTSALVSGSADAPSDIPFKKGPSEKSERMTNARIDSLVRKIDKNVTGKAGYWQFTVDNTSVTIVTDEKADRMRILVPVVEAKELNEKMMFRLLQANFDSALDARYSIAKDVLWSAYIHPLSTLNAKTFLAAIGQVVNLSSTYGGSFSSGALIFKGGDSEDLQRRELIDELIKKGLAT